jgi:hypothetical protein
MGAASASDDAFLSVVRYMPIVFIFAGVMVVVWLSGQRLPQELEPDVLAALSETEALPTLAIRHRPPLAYQNVDLRMLERVLNQLCASGLVVRWYESADSERRAVYRRVGSGPKGGGVR